MPTQRKTKKAKPTTRRKPAQAKPPTCYAVLRAARSLIDDGAITNKDMASRVGIAASTLAAMLEPTYQNKTLDSLDSIRCVVRELRA